MIQVFFNPVSSNQITTSKTSASPQVKFPKVQLSITFVAKIPCQRVTLRQIANCAIADPDPANRTTRDPCHENCRKADPHPANRTTESHHRAIRTTAHPHPPNRTPRNIPTMKLHDSASPPRKMRDIRNSSLANCTNVNSNLANCSIGNCYPAS